MKGIEKVTPVLAGVFLVAGLAGAGLPGLAPFVSELMVLISAFDHAWWAGAIAVTAIVLAAIYMLWMYQRTMTGPTPPSIEGMPDLDAPGDGRGRTAAAGAGAVRLLPDAPARRDQPLRRVDAGPGRGHRRPARGAGLRLRHADDSAEGGQE